MDTGKASGSETGCRLELWGGIECTVNRVRSEYFSQLDRNGEACGLDQIDRFATLGIRALRFPVLWERVAPDGPDGADWSWTDPRLARLVQLGIRPIVGLVHHGSGPRDTSLVDPAFPEKLADYALAVARRHPGLGDYTPVNEPLTTARFAGLYGLWYPHGRDERVFMSCLLHECRATVLAMRAIRSVNPQARLVQTDDLGRTYSTPLLSYQADFNNELRWLSWDLLCGRVDRTHALWGWLRDCCGASEAELAWFAENPCPPDVVGINHYVTSDRFLDEDLSKHPPALHGGNHRHRYVDVEAARVLEAPTGGIAPLLLEAWQRYRLPLAVTEAHIDARREDQLRWLGEIWTGAETARRQGADVRAVTAWALLGSFDWNSLLTERRDYYELGAFDLRGGQMRPTAVASMLASLGAGRAPAHPVLAGSGWWRRPGRHCRQPVPACGPGTGARASARGRRTPILITGANGTLGRAFARICAARDLEHRVLSRSEMDIGNPDAIEEAMIRHEPWAVLNAAGYVRVDDAEREVERCFRENTLGPARLAAACARHRIPLVTFSSDLVFDGAQQAPYVEADGVAPLNVYGRSKAEAEQRVLDRHPESLVVRTSSFFGPWDQHNFITLALRALREGRRFAAASDMTVSPTYVPDLVHTCLDLLIDQESGIWHLSNGQAITWSGLALLAARLAEVDPATLHACGSEQLGLQARRPGYSALGSTRSFPMPSLEDALRRYLGECEPVSH